VSKARIHIQVSAGKGQLARELALDADGGMKNRLVCITAGAESDGAG
jgi:hypothetical protein